MRIKARKYYKNTKTTESETELVVRLHRTDILTYDKVSRTLHLQDGGWNTPTTRRRMKEALGWAGVKAWVTSKENVCTVEFIGGPSVQLGGYVMTVYVMRDNSVSLNPPLPLGEFTP